VANCSHLIEAGNPAPLAVDECIGCREEGRADWVHLRLCLNCGYVGCCDSSPRRHATAHFVASEHPVMRSFEANEAWRWCFVDEALG
jgi:uncharacterized UBP type Zn finger protein